MADDTKPKHHASLHVIEAFYMEGFECSHLLMIELNHSHSSK